MVKIQAAILVGSIVCIHSFFGMDTGNAVLPKEFYQARAEEYIKMIGGHCDGLKSFLEERSARAKERLRNVETEENKRELRLLDGQFVDAFIPTSMLSLPAAIFSRMAFENFSYRARMELGCYSKDNIEGMFAFKQVYFPFLKEVSSYEFQREMGMKYNTEEKMIQPLLEESDSFAEAILSLEEETRELS